MRTKRIHEESDDMELRIKDLATEVQSASDALFRHVSTYKNGIRHFFNDVLYDNWITSDVILDAKADVKYAIRDLSADLKRLKALYKELETTGTEYLGYAMRRDMGDDYLR